MLKVGSKESKEKESPGGPADDVSAARGRNGGPRTSGPQTVSVLGGGMTVNGDVTGEGEFRIEGRVEGSVTTRGRVIVDASGEVEGGIEAEEIVASGKVSGKITAKGAVRLKKGCRVQADVQAAAIELEEGGVVNGRLEMKTKS